MVPAEGEGYKHLHIFRPSGRRFVDTPLWHIVIAVICPKIPPWEHQGLERRAYFIFGDILACAVTGAAAGWLAQAAIPGDWQPMIAMAVGMLLGFPVGVVGGILFTPLFGALEISLPAGLAGMMAGSVAGMLQAAAEVGPGTALWSGALVGLACLAYSYILQARLHGEVR